MVESRQLRESICLLEKVNWLRWSAPMAPGKARWVQAVCGLLNEWKGEIRFENELLAGLKPSSIVKRGISMVPEGRMIFSTLSVLDNLKLGAYTRYRKKNGRSCRK